jgi:dTDP-4-dehydrorhamnose reductase
MKLLITGGNGQLAHHLVRSAQQLHYNVLALNRLELDIIKLPSLQVLIENFKPDAIINTAAYTKVDLAESEVASAFQVNSEGAKNLAIACQKQNCQLIHISTDYIFDGKLSRPYIETDMPSPLNIYGQTKLAGENYVRELCENHMILRVSSVFSHYGVNFVKTILRLNKEIKQLRIIADQVSCPTPAKAIAETILTMLLNPCKGTYHYCGDQIMSWYEFACKILQNSKNIQPISTQEYPSSAIRPKYSVLDCNKLYLTFGIKLANFEQGLAEVLHHPNLKNIFTCL